MTGFSPPLAAVSLFFLAATVAPTVVLADGGATFGLDFHHRFSDHVQSWAGPAAWGEGGRPPERGTAEYYAALAEHDRALLRGRGLASAQGPLTFAGGNKTVSYINLAFLYYSWVSIGTPNVSFLVALDTGSDLFWVPCDCKQCASTKAADFRFDNKTQIFNTFRSNFSSTSKKVPCSSNLCELKSSCSAAADACPYEVKYLSPNTTTSGYLLEDVLYLSANDSRNLPLQARVTIGCGQVQTGSFLVSGGFNGIIGLGLSKISVPSTLADSGLTSNSFSMCFGKDDTVGRIVFGDKGGVGQQTTPIMATEPPSYIVSVMGLQMNNNSLSTSFKAFFDTGTSLTSLADPVYTTIAQAFDALVPYQRISLPQQQQPQKQPLFEYCYVTSPNPQVVVPTLQFIMNGGSKYPVLRPVLQLVGMTSEGTKVDLYCLGLIKNSQVNIIGQNFMSGLKIVFDREKLELGWKEFNCYDKEKPLPTGSHNTSFPPFVGNEPNSTPNEVIQQTGGASEYPLNAHNFIRQTVAWSLVLSHLIQFLFPVF